MGTFHTAKGGAATSPEEPLCTDAGQMDTGDAEETNSGSCRVEKKKGVTEMDGEVFSVEELVHWLCGRLDVFSDRHCKTQPSGKTFPLPTSSSTLSQCFPEESPVVLDMLRSLVVSLNSLNGEWVFCGVPPSGYQKEVLQGLVEDCRRMVSWQEVSARVSWEEFFRCRGVDYRGEEILTAKSIRWENVRGTLPDEVGGVPLEEVVELGSRHYTLNFEDYLLAEEDQVYTKPPRVMIPPEHWEELCSGLMDKGVFSRVHEDDIHRVKGELLLNGLFGVTKGAYEGQWELMRLIMNLVPVNQVCRSMDGDVGTLPSWAGMSPLCLMPEEDLVVSSEDVRCFFYIFRIPLAWHRYMAFNRPLPPSLCGDKPGKWYPCSAVLPMGFKNSVSLAQHVHRCVVQRALRHTSLGTEAELRKDRPFTASNPCYRVYLDNFDELAKVSKRVSDAIEGKVSPLVAGLREEYLALGIPRHPKKGVASAFRAEVQGAIVDGKEGIAFPKPEKILKYAQLGLLLVDADQCTQKQAQVVGGGFVYCAMFRRPLLGCLNALWTFISSFEGYPPFIRLEIPSGVKTEIARFVGLLPLAFMDFRCKLSKQVTASDASETGGGVTVSAGVTPMGCVACTCPVRGDVVEPSDVTSVLTVGLFDGIGALRVAVDALGWHVQGHVSVEVSKAAQRVVESKFPNTITVDGVQNVTWEEVKSWARRFSQVGVVLLGAGPPCQGVSGLNAARKGALRDARSNLFTHVPRIRDLLQAAFPWAQIRSLMESVASMDKKDRDIMSESFGGVPWHIDASGVSLARRPRLYWVDWELANSEGAIVSDTPGHVKQVHLSAQLNDSDYLQPGWKRSGTDPLPTFTTSRPRGTPGYKPAGLAQCTEHEQERWRSDCYCFPPYQYRDCFSLVNKHDTQRIPDISEREVIMGFPRDYTLHSRPKSQQGTTEHVDERLSVVGNSWNVTVVAWLLSQLGSVLGLNPPLSVKEIVQRTSPGSTKDFQTYLQRPLMSQNRGPVSGNCEEVLVKKLLTLVSVKGEDLLLQAASEEPVKYHRLRASIPAKLWRWRTVTGWHWRGNREHINVLEMRAVLTSVRWRIERQKKVRTKFVHLVDSLVCLHALSRGRSSSKKLKRTLLRTNALLLASKSQVVWAYVHTSQNPADAPSRRPRKRKWINA
eukprot:s76_g25.t1